MKRQRTSTAGFLRGPLLSLAGGLAVTAFAATTDIAQKPLFIAQQVEPAVMVMLDNSGSMKEPMYRSGKGQLAAFDPQKTYYGMFESNQTYRYDPNIPVDTSAYQVPIDSAVAGAFVADSSCNPATENEVCWDGNFLNWLTTRRIDASRMVLIGGKVENRAGYDYLNTGSKQYKIVGNNERSDGSFAGSYALSSLYSPIANGEVVEVFSPANDGAAHDAYDPYAKIRVASNGLIDKDGKVIGEFGSATVQTSVDSNKNLQSSSWTHVTFQHAFDQIPVVIAGPPSYNGGDPGVVRIRNVTQEGFEIAFQEWKYRDGNHTKETIPYLAVLPGTHTLPGNKHVVAGTVETNKTYSSDCNGKEQGSFSDVTFPEKLSATPVVLASAITFNGADPIGVRVRNVTQNGFEVALEEERAQGVHTTETVGYVAIEPGSVTLGALRLIVGAADVSSSGTTIGFSDPFDQPPYFLATINSVKEADTAVLRTKSVTANSATLFIEKEKSCGNKSGVSHGSESVGYLAVSSTQSYNIAVVVPALKEGILQKVQNKVRLGVSFYRFDPNSNDIYNGNTIDGGTLRFKIPKNPFVKKPTDSNLPAKQQGYRELDGYIGSSIETIIDAIEHYPLVWGTTPLAENLWEVIRYFAQESPYYQSVVNGFPDFELADTSHPERDPYYHPGHQKKMECTRANVLIFTDGEPYKDANIPESLVDYDGDGKTAANCQDKDNKNADCADSDPNAWGHDNLDDVAYYAFCDKSQGSCFDANGKAVKPSRDLRTDITGDQYLRIDTVGFAGGDLRQILVDTANNAGGSAYAAEDGLALADALQQVFTKIVGSSAAAVAISSTSLQTESRVFLGRFDSTDWSGNLLAFKIKADGSLEHTVDANGLMMPGPNGWQASIPKADDRVIVTSAQGSGVPFRWSDLTKEQKALLDPDALANQATSSPILSYLRGDQTQELQNGGTLRNRSSVLGDIVNSSPVYVGSPNFVAYPDNMEAVKYSVFRKAYAKRTPMIYVGANDGMLHAFDAATGEERFAYVPNAVLKHLAALANPDYTHRFTVDSTPTVVDAFFGDAWHTVLVGGLGAGGQGLYALDVTDPTAWATEAAAKANVLWEFTDANDDDLGATFSRPNVVKLHNGDWAVVVGNGYGNTDADEHVSNTGNAVLYLIRLSDGQLIRKIDTEFGLDTLGADAKPNGLSTVAPVDVDGDAVVDYVYGGDLYGNLWKFDLTNSSPSQWDVAIKSQGKPAPLFTACAGDTCTTANRQPITVRPQVAYHPTGKGYLVFFGTGKFFEEGDNSATNQVTQTFYAVWDTGNANDAPVTRGTLKARKILAQGTVSGRDVRVTSGVGDSDSNGGGAIDWTKHKGWYLDLVYNGTNDGERVIADPLLRGERVIFTTMIPSSDPCGIGGSGWLMELNAEDGTRLDSPPFDLNADELFTEEDEVTLFDHNDDNKLDENDHVAASGVKSAVGIPSQPGVVATESAEKKFISGTSGNIEVVTEQAGKAKSGRLSWRQIR